MKKKNKCLVWTKIHIIVLLLIIGFTTVFKFYPIQALSCDSIDIKVHLLENGDAYIEEVWTMYIDEGTEVYKDESQLGDSEILDFNVIDDLGNQYTNIGSWNIDASFKDKAYKCGINETSKGQELCWGISNYGQRTYTLRYIMTNFVHSYNDYDGFNQRLINDEMNQPPQRFSIVIEADPMIFTDENTQYWGFGFEGELYLNQDGLEIYNEKRMSSSNHATIMMRFNKGMFSPSIHHNESFDVLKEKATKSDHLSFQAIIMTILAVMFFSAMIILLIYVIYFYYSAKSVKKVNISNKGLNYFRDIPFKSDLILSYYGLIMSNELKNDTDIIGAYLLKWTLDKNIRITESETKKIFSTQKEPTIEFISDQSLADEELELYHMFKKASGKDEILQTSEFERWAKKHYDEVENWLNSVKKQGEDRFKSLNYIDSKEKSGLFGLLKTNQQVISQRGLKHIQELLGFKKYLNEFTLINEREIIEVHIWKDYLIFAGLFGIAKEVSKQLKDIYPKYFASYEGYYDDPYYTIMMVNHISHSFHQGYQAGYESSHSSSIGGGGGFSGGGSGGGVR